jgi:dipeptidyl aminopeptidase/acylaminoacyl peptidase
VLVEYRERPEQLWSWSYTGEYVAFSTYDAVARVRTLYYLDAQGQSLIAVEDDPSQAWDWSPDQRYISFVGRCSSGSCNKVFDIESQQVVWTSQGLPGFERNATYLTWSYDSKYIVVLADGTMIIDIETGERIRHFKDLKSAVIVWSP